MGKAVVLLFLLDTLPDFNKVIDRTQHLLLPDTKITPCSQKINAALLEVINKKLGFTTDTSGPELSEKYKITDSFEDLASDTLSNTIYDNSVQDTNVDNFVKSMNIDYEDVEGNKKKEKDVSECEKPSINLKFNKQNSTKESYPERAPFLAAIFETVSNVTAQTCGGVLLGTSWVLTAASCVNVLGHIYGNTSHQKILYTIVIGATNPLTDGTVHNVSEIIIHPNASQHSESSFLKGHETVKSPILALMRIEPGLKTGILEIAEVKKDLDVTADLYGWALLQNETGANAMLATSIPVEVLSADKCDSLYGGLEHESLCLLTNDAAPDVTRMTSGGPVVVARGRRLLGLALADGSPLVASALSAHRDWIQEVVGTHG